MAVTFGVLGNDTDQDDGDTLAVTSTTQPRRGSVVLDTNTQMLTYTPAENDHDTYTFTYRATDGTLSSEPAQVTVTVNAVNDPPEFETEMTTRTVSESAQPGDEVGTKVEATDVDDITLTYSLSGASDFVIDASGPTAGQIRVAPGVTLDREHTSSYEVTVTATDRFEVGQHHRHHQRLQRERGPDRHERHRDDRRGHRGQNRRAGQRHGPRYGEGRAEGLGADSAAQRTRTRRERPRPSPTRRTRTSPAPNSFTYRVSDGSLSDDGSVTVTVEAVNDAPTFPRRRPRAPSPRTPRPTTTSARP